MMFNYTHTFPKVLLSIDGSGTIYSLTAANLHIPYRGHFSAPSHLQVSGVARIQSISGSPHAGLYLAAAKRKRGQEMMESNTHAHIHISDGAHHDHSRPAILST